jgi:hypothetical protein
MINCTELDEAVEDTRVLLLESDGGFFLLVASLLLGSGLLLLRGEKLVRPMSALVGGVGATVAVFVLTALLDDMTCVARLVASGVAGVLAAVLALCIFKTGLFVLGAGGFGAVAHLIYESLPLQDVKPPFVLLGRSGYYYLTLLVAGVVGAGVAYAQRTHFVRISSSLVGGGGVSLGVWLLAERAGEDLPPLVLLAVLVVCTVGGVAVQRHLDRRGRRQRRRRREDDDRRSIQLRVGD